MRTNFTHGSAGRGMRNAIIFPAFLFFLLISPGINNYLYAQGPTVSWSYAAGSTGTDVENAALSDAAGNTYHTGQFAATVDFDPGTGNTPITSAGSSDVYIWKLDPSGALIWIKTLGSTGADVGSSIQLDATGNLYIGGSFTGTVDFDPDPTGSAPLTSAGGADGFILKLDLTGNFLWARNIGGTATDAVQKLLLDNSGNIYAAGGFAGTADMDPGASTYNLISAGGNDVFLLKLDASGNFIWAGSIGGTSSESVNSLAVDPSGNVYFGGLFSGTVDFDPGAGSFPITASASNAYVVKLASNGTFAWAGSVASASTTNVATITSDASGNMYITGSFAGTADLDLSAGTANTVSNGANDAFVTKIDGSGNPIWIKNFGATGTDGVSKMTMDASGNIYLVGTFTGTVDFDPGAGTADLTGNGFSPFFLLKLDASGNYIYASEPFTVTNNSAVFETVLDPAGNLYIVGRFSGSITIGANTYPAVGGADLFMAKFGSAVLPLHLLGFNAWPDNDQVHLKWITAQEENVSHFAIERSSDGIQFSIIGRVDAKNSLLSTEYTYADKAPLPGTSYYRLKLIDLDGHFTSSRIQMIKSTDKGATPQVYPVPARDVITISTIGISRGTGTITIQLYNLVGQILKSESMQTGGVHDLHVSTLVKGQYVLRLIGENGFTSSHTILVQ